MRLRLLLFGRRGQLDSEDLAFDASAVPPVSAAAAFAHLFQRPLSSIGLAILAVVVALSLFPSLIAPDDPVKISLDERLLPPSGSHLFGTDDFGRDILSRVVHGAHISLVIAVIVVSSAVILGGTLGAVAGYRGGWLDELVMRVTDVFMAFPNILLPMVVVVVLKPSLVNTTLALGLVWWPAYARLMRGQTLAVKQQAYVESAVVLGARPFRVLRRYVVPNAFPPLLVLATMDLGFVVLTAAGLGFLGLGAQPPAPEWGAMISAGLGFFLEAWWYPVFPGIAIAMTVLAFNLLGDDLRDWFDPKTD